MTKARIILRRLDEQGKEVPLSYKANRKAWMTADLFEEWLKQWDRKLKRDGRKILLVLDNFSGHTKIPLDQITLLFLPPNTTAASQPFNSANRICGGCGCNVQ
uniref:DDE-1 domain-containing protein n=1 Tax=Ditylenchus dipsaci TaxID=166011 RepID=A0A915E739_9BILA